MKLRKMGFILLVALLICAVASAQVETEKARLDNAVAAFKKDHPRAKIEFNEKTGLPKRMKSLIEPGSIGLAPGPQAKLEDVDRIVNSFFSDNQALFLQAGPVPSIKIVQKKMDPQFSNRAIARVQQTIEGIDIYGAEAAVSVDLVAQDVDKLTSTFVPPPTIDLKPKVSKEESTKIAQENYERELALTPTQPRPNEP